MDCKAMEFWSLTGLVGAFLDLFIAYFLLCASAFAYFASKVLGIFGLSLPCPNNGLFGIPNSAHCVQRLLVNYPTDKISSVQLSVRSKFPFDSILVRNQNGDVKMDLGRNEKSCNVNGFGEFDGEASCSSNTTRSDARRIAQCWEEREFDRKGKGVVNHRPRGGFRRRRKSSIDNGQFLSASSHGWIKFVEQQSIIQSPCSIHKEEIERIEGSSSYNYERKHQAFEYIDSDESETEDRFVSFEEPKSNEQGQCDFYSDKENTIRLLEQELKEERAACAALYLELEKERNAAATAADEAMAMILRLQEEKASIEMEARQYQRILEEKSTYDAEEMDILKEIILRREREKHFLEKEVESYRKMIYGNEQSDGDVLDFAEEDLMLQQLNASIIKKEPLKDRSFGVTEQGDLEKRPSQVSECDSFACHEFQEKEIVSVDYNLPPKDGKEVETYLKSYLPEKTIPVVVEEKEGHMAKKNVEKDMEGKGSGSDVSLALPPESSKSTSTVSELRRNSMSALDNERIKIDTEVEWLRERLRIVQEGREKLNLSKEQGEREKLQLQLLEDIAHQLREIRLMTEPVKTRQASLPPHSSQGMTKKRRCRSASFGVPRSS